MKNKDFSAQMTGAKDVQERIQKLRRMYPGIVRDVINETGLAIQTNAKKNLTDEPVVDTGRLRSSVKLKITALGFTGRVGSDLNYAPYIEFGTEPHFPPLDPIKEWVRRHKKIFSAKTDSEQRRIAFLIARKISEQGTPAKPWLHPAYQAEKPKFAAAIKTAFRNKFHV